ncbi:DUF262 domain-containing protein [Altererythrobacter confluentis]|uniref:DUF262 domain-containing protein n=1 Tax=Allopontixanthobacter confluentis TaxID=1849021 RepID=A0A6L7GEJ0_9SPHN|nr:DUF262 domain-containing protein [Allopontixanthobacter confluentis]MXP14512.1 DUF262 domain-containing protein [Allopontixanthobacter confluentis]
MSTQSIDSKDLQVSDVFKDFYRVPDYQREYVWGESDRKGERGDEVDKFLDDIYRELDAADGKEPPEYFIGTIVVCQGEDGVFDLIDGQQRMTTSFLTLCAIRDALVELEAEIPDTLASQIASSSTDWKGDTVGRMRLDLQYEDAQGILAKYGEGEGFNAPDDDTRSIANLANAYKAVREFLTAELSDDPKKIKLFYGYFTNKVKLIRIETPNVSRALKIFETINDRGVGLDAMDLLKNLLFMHADAKQFDALKGVWKDLTQTLYNAGEKPLRFLRYFIMANYSGDEKLREDEIYGWLSSHAADTGHEDDPVGFAGELKAAAKAYANFLDGKGPDGKDVRAVANSRKLGGSAIKQHFILYLAGRHLSSPMFARLAREIENLLCVWLIAGVPAKDYERQIAKAARKLQSVSTQEELDDFVTEFLTSQKRRHRDDFHRWMATMHTWDLRQYRLRYLLAKITQHVEVEARGRDGLDDLSHFLDTKNDIEHIYPQTPTDEAEEEFGDEGEDENITERLGNLLWVEQAINRAATNKPYSEKLSHYDSSSFILARSQASFKLNGVNDQITKAVKRLRPEAEWSAEAIERRQKWIADRAMEVWDVPAKADATENAVA